MVVFLRVEANLTGVAAMLRNSLIFTLFILLTACGGGGGGGVASGGVDNTTPTDPDKSFSLSTLQSTTQGTVYTSQLTGSDSDGTSYTGSLSMANRAQTMLNGVLVTPKDLLISFTGGGVSITITGTSSIDTSGNLISLVIQTTGVTCTPVSPDRMPASVKIGDFGFLSTLTCSDNTTEERNWRVEDAGNGNIRVISNGTIKDQFNTIISVTDVTYIINGDGNVVSFKTVSTLSASGFTLTYQSV